MINIFLFIIFNLIKVEKFVKLALCCTSPLLLPSLLKLALLKKILKAANRPVPKRYM